MILYNSPAEILRRVFDEFSIGDDVTIGTQPAHTRTWPMYRSKFGDKPDNAIALYDTTGQLDNREQIAGEYDEHPGVMIQIRAIDYTTGHRKAEQIKDAVDRLVYDYDVMVGVYGYNVHSVSRKGTINSLGQEEGTGRVLFSINVIMNLLTTIIPL